MPGVTVKGRPLPGTGERLTYNCNGIASFWASNAIMVALNHFEVFKFTDVYDNLGQFIIVSMVAGDLVSFLLYSVSIATGRDERMSGNPVYDYFMCVCMTC